MSEKMETEQLQKLLEAYGENELIQSYKKSSTDSQLNSIALSIQEIIYRTVNGTVLDIGCGTGILLSKLTDIKAFIDNKGWMYVGADYNDLDDILQFAVELKVHRRCDVIHLDEFYSSWIESIDTPKPLLVFVRNVLHELTISDTSKLLLLLNNNMQPEDTLLIQDLLVFPQAERGHVCWDSDCLENVLNQVGFEPCGVITKTQSGAQWVSIIIQKSKNAKLLSMSEVTNIVANGRLTQLEKWRAIEKLPSDIRLNKIAQLDFDLQLASLYNQLCDAGYIGLLQKQDAPVLDAKKAFQLALNRYDPSILDRDKYKLPYLHNFRDRANSQDSLELSLKTTDAVVIIQGGTACGKTVLVSHVLSRRAYERSIVPIDCASANDVWPILEQYLFAIGCQASFEALIHERELSFTQLDEQLRNLLEMVSSKTIVVFDHFENILDPNGKIANAEIRDLLTLMVSANKAKVIITTRKIPILDFFPESVVIADEQPPVGRFPEGPYVQNILDDYVDRTAVGLEEYPDELLKAIDRYPYLATLAGQLIAEAGITIAHDPIMLRIIQSYLYDELVKKIASPTAQPALDLACILRIPSPASLFQDIVGKEATVAAQETGLLFLVSDRYHQDLLSCAAVLRDSYSSSDPTDSDTSKDRALIEIHTRIARCYEKMSYSTHSDPRWIREAHYHYLASGNLSDLHKVGSLYKDELFWAGQTLFRRFHIYNHALELLSAAEAMGFIIYESRMMIASCLIRTGKRKLGTTYYNELIADYPHHIGVKTSFVDSLLNIREYADALNLLNEYEFSDINASAWIMGQFGRAYLGLHEYPQAAYAFELQLQKESNSQAIVYVRLAQAYFRNGDRDKAQHAIVTGLNKYKDDPVLNSLYYSNLIRDNSPSNLETANEQLNQLLLKNPRNGYVLQKLVKVSSSLGHLQQILTHLEKIHWQVTPPYLELPIRISVLLSQDNYKKALEKANELPSHEEYTIPTIYKIYLSWAYAERSESGKQKIAEEGIKRELPLDYFKNIPILTMYAQLAYIANNEERYKQAISLIASIKPELANTLYDFENLDTRNFEPEAP